MIRLPQPAASAAPPGPSTRLTNGPQAVRIEELLSRVGLWRSLGARFHGMEEVVGSIPTRSTNRQIKERVPACRGGRRFDPDQVHQINSIIHSPILNSRSIFGNSGAAGPRRWGGSLPVFHTRQVSARQSLIRSLICLRFRLCSSACLANSTTSSSAAKRRPMSWSSLRR